MPTQTAPRTECPTCGARITRPELSLCSYCATPLGIGEKPEGADEATLKRLARMHEHKDWDEAMSWEPSEQDDAPGAASGRARATWMLAVGSALALWGLLAALLGAGGFLRWQLIGGAALILFGLWARARAASVLARIRRQELKKRAAVVIDRRSVTDATPLGARTVYFFSLQFEDGSSGEFSFLGRGGNFEVPANGTTGLACTRGARLLELLRLRV